MGVDVEELRGRPNVLCIAFLEIERQGPFLSPAADQAEGVRASETDQEET